MRKVITINLNGKAYQVEEGGYESLRRYLDQAEAQLAGNPDRQEILTDLEQAIGDKCDGFLGAHKNVVSALEIAQVIREMGPVEGATGAGVAGADADAAAATAAPGAEASRPVRRLYRIPDQKLIAGVCTGLAAYFRIDVVLVRIVFVVLTLATGVFAFLYLVMLFIVPRANSPADVAAAHGQPFTARDVMDRAKKKNDSFSAA